MNVCFELRTLTEQIFSIRENILPKLRPSSNEYIETEKLYNQLCVEREALEERLFYK